MSFTAKNTPNPLQIKDGLTFWQVGYRITFIMEAEKQIWQGWIESLHRRRLGSLVALLLEASGPLNVVAAQMVYLGQPLVGSSRSHGQLQALAHLLEDADQTQSFVTDLREGAPR